MNPVPLKIEIRGIDDAAGTLQAVRNAVADRRQLHAELAVNAGNFTKDYLLATPRHNTATRWGATPTNFRAKNAAAVQAESDAEGAVLRFPRRTGLGRAFADITITPGPGRTYLTIPAVAETYGKVVRDFPDGTFSFTVLGGRYPALVFTDGWRVAYWLRRSVTQKQDRTLLPSDSAYQELGRRVCVAHIATLVYNS